MSKHNRERRRARKVPGVNAIQQQGAPEYSAETIQKIAALEVKAKLLVPAGGVFRVAVYHEQFCVDAYKRGAKKCSCSPDVVLLDDGQPKVGRDLRALKAHWLNDVI